MPVTPSVIALVAIVAGFIAVGLFDAFRPEPNAKKTLGEEPCGSGTCNHEWKKWDGGTCMPRYSSYGGSDPCEEWYVESCSVCGSKFFYCSGSCDCYSECAAVYGGDSR